MHRSFNIKSRFIKDPVGSTIIDVTYENTFITSRIKFTNVVLTIVMNKAFESKYIKIHDIRPFVVPKLIGFFLYDRSDEASI